MKIKKFNADSVSEALKKVKSDLGENAIILNTRDIGRMFPGKVGGASVEITAAIDCDKPQDISKRRTSLSNRVNNVPINRIEKMTSNNSAEEAKKINELFGAHSIKYTAEKCMELMPGEIGRLYRKLPFLNIDPRIVDEIALATMSGGLPGDMSEPFSKRWAEFVASKCKSADDIDVLIKAKPILFTGRTGCGRTTLISQLALAMIKKGVRNLSIVSLDNYNSSGIYALRRIAKLLGVKFSSTKSPSIFKKIISLWNPKHPLMVDLPIIDSDDDDEIRILKIASEMDAFKVVVVDSSKHFGDLISLSNQFDIFTPTHLSATHTGCGISAGTIISLMIKFNLIPLVGSASRKIASQVSLLNPAEISAAFFSKIELEDEGNGIA